ncbi:MAG: hypothetical protein HYX24_02155 [Candidatus Aenigmarchaeota archaeon]|nr:hypothetical protein [Candidatus Aenigmarchaeota archaeon]
MLLFLFASLFLLSSPLPANADISACDADDVSFDSCISSNAEKIGDCMTISDSIHLTSCAERFLESTINETECEAIDARVRAKCYSFAVLNNYPDNITKCYGILYSYQEECVRTFVGKKRISDPNYCLEVKKEMQAACSYQATLNKYPFFDNGASENACDAYEGEIKKGCLDYFKFRKTAFDITKIFVGSFFAVIIGSFALFIIIVLAVIVIILRRSKAEEKK